MKPRSKHQNLPTDGQSVVVELESSFLTQTNSRSFYFMARCLLHTDACYVAREKSYDNKSG